MDRRKIFEYLKKEATNSERDIDGYNVVDVFLSDVYLRSLSSMLALKTGLGKTLLELLFRLKEWFLLLFISTPITQRTVDIVFLPAGRNHFIQMKDVAIALRKQGYTILFLTNRVHIYRLLKREDFPVQTIRYFAIPIFSLVTRSRSEESVVRGVTRNGYRTMVRQMNFYKSAFEMLIQTAQPKALVCGYDITFEGRLATLVFKRKSIFTCCIQHGDMPGMLSSEHVVDEFYVYGDAVRRKLESINRRDTRFIVTGAPYVKNNFYVAGSNLKSTIPCKLGLANRPYVILVTFSGPGNNTSQTHHARLIESIFSLTSIVGVNIIVKLHKKDRYVYYQPFFDRTKPDNLSIVSWQQPDMPLSFFDWLKGCDLLITGGSTTAVEAMLVGIPVITIDLEGEYSNVSFIESRATVHIQDSSDLKPAVENMLRNTSFRDETLQRQKPFLEDYFFRLDGKASERCVGMILSALAANGNEKRPSLRDSLFDGY